MKRQHAVYELQNSVLIEQLLDNMILNLSRAFNEMDCPEEQVKFIGKTVADLEAARTCVRNANSKLDQLVGAIVV